MIKIYRTWARPRQGFFSFHWTIEAMKYEVPCPRPAHRSFADPSGTNFFRFFLFYIASGSFLFFFPLLLISSYSSLLILLLLPLLILLFLYFKLFVVLHRDMHINDIPYTHIHMSVILRGVSEGAKPFFYPFGANSNVYKGATIRPNFLFCPFLLLFLSFFLGILFVFFSSF